MKFLNFYFKNKIKPISKSDPIYIKINETEYNRLVDEFGKDYKYLLEIREYKNDFGYGFEYVLNNDSFVLLNKFKDETVNEEARLIFNSEETFNKINETYKIQILERGIR
jgi:hypothetical protein